MMLPTIWLKKLHSQRENPIINFANISITLEESKLSGDNILIPSIGSTKLSENHQITPKDLNFNAKE